MSWILKEPMAEVALVALEQEPMKMKVLKLADVLCRSYRIHLHKLRVVPTARLPNLP